MGRIIFAGDTVLDRDSDGVKVSEEINQIFTVKDFFCCNIEAPSKGTIDNQHKLGIHFDYNNVGEISSAGINIAVLSNNHIMDCGVNGLDNTINDCEKNGILHVGAGKGDEAYKPIVLKCSDGVTVALFAYTQHYYDNVTDDNTGAADIFDNRVITEILSIKGKVDFIVVNAHCGLENINVPLRSVEKRYKLLIDIGVDIIIGNHPHIIQGMEIYKGKYIYYSLGNFAFDVEKKYIPDLPDTWYDALIVVVDFDKTKHYRADTYKGRYDNRVISRLSKCCLPILDVKSLSLGVQYKDTIKNVFGNYLDEIQTAFLQPEVDVKLLYHYLALDSQRMVLEESLKMYYKEGKDRLPCNMTLDLYIRPIIIWGNGNTGEHFYKFLRMKRFVVAGFTDSFCDNTHVMEVDNESIIVYSYEEAIAMEKTEKCQIVIASVYENEIRTKFINETLHFSSEKDVCKELLYNDYNAWKGMNWSYDKTERYSNINYRISRTEKDSTDIILVLHGAGGNGCDNMTQILEMGNLSNALISIQRRFPCSIIFPQCPYSTKWVDVSYEKGQFNMDDFTNEQTVDHVVQFILDKYPDKKIHIIGYSLGAFAAWYVLNKYTGLVKKAIIISGGGDRNYSFDEKMPEVLLIHGSDDEIVPVDGSRGMHQVYLNSQYIEIKKKGHQLMYDVSEEAWENEILPWLFSVKTDLTRETNY